MDLQRQGGGGEQGYAMAALLVMLTIMAILMTAAMPVWRQQAQREKEEELVFRGQQYVRAIRLFQMKNQALPSSIDMLVDGRYIRKKFKDPITDDDFVPLGAAQGAAGQIGQLPGQLGQRGGSVPGQRGGGVPGQPGVGVPGQRGGAVPGQPGGSFVGQPGGSFVGQPGGSFVGQPGGSFPGAQGPPVGGVIVVASKSKAESIRIYQGRTHYNEWAFVFVNAGPGRGGVPGQAQPGLPGQGQPFPGRGGRGVGPGGASPNPFPSGPGRGGRGGTVPSIERPGGSATPFPTFPGRGGRGGL